ncbi:Gfo/Idh/MocA family oxidoreductase [Candidatus Bathyarchaeota archaeon]|nr:Gfo/Idh/MocA family oxidoreductase [Candidatus Bathyarchaeota archaeon]
MKKIGVAVIGVGFWGRNHARVYMEIPEAELIGVCDINSERAKETAEKYGVEAYTDSRKLLKRDDVDAVSICTWTTTHAKETIRALKAGKHVLVEKPIASTVREAKRIVQMAEREELILMTGFIERFNPGIERVIKTINGSSVGEIVSATARRVSQWPERIGDVGVVKDSAIHDIDMMRYIFGEDPKNVFAKAGKLRHKRFEDYAQIMLTFSHGKTAFIEANWLTPYKVRKLIVTGSKGIVTLDYLSQEIVIETEEKTFIPRYKWEEPLKRELEHYVKCVIENKQPLVSGLDGLKALIICEAALKSAAKEKSINLEKSLGNI